MAKLKTLKSYRDNFPNMIGDTVYRVNDIDISEIIAHSFTDKSVRYDNGAKWCKLESVYVTHEDAEMKQMRNFMKNLSTVGISIRKAYKLSSKIVNEYPEELLWLKK